ncbi:hypothetical protein PIB30_000702 [Stylosanthes scabra]|uniref:Ubiquitin-like protease family profile domain-containing protein n=1 Tax=Stylosanthes scabra TaxID=79078 RepID=A0ABU6Z1Q3_9FABA|nr:hypothetical protein [Stylosanthes scabra]
MKKKSRVSAKGGRDDSSSRELPTIVEDEVSGVDNQVGGFLREIKEDFKANHDLVVSKLRDNAAEMSTMKVILSEQGNILEVLANKVAILEGAKKFSPKGISAVQRGAALLADSKDPDSNARPAKRKLEILDLNEDDTAILYLIRQRGIGSPFAFYHHKGLVMLGEETPKCLDLLFWPPSGMRFDGDDLAVAVFIFATGMEESERLVDDSHCDGSRKRLLFLLPGAQLYDDVINLVVGMCSSHKESSMSWWLPTTFSRMILYPDEMSAGTMEYIKNRYMGIADDLLMYLMIVDIWDRKLVYLDSLKSDDAEETGRRLKQMREVAKYLGMLVKSRTLWKNKDACPPLIADFNPEQPMTGQQAAGSMDCGVWVCQWMLNSHKWLDYDIEPIDASTRMRIATQLVSGRTIPWRIVLQRRRLSSGIQRWSETTRRKLHGAQLAKAFGEAQALRFSLARLILNFLVMHNCCYA